MNITAVQVEKLVNNQEKIVLSIPDGSIQCIFHTAGSEKSVIWLCGALGGMDGPSFGIFRILAERLISDGINSLRLHYSQPGDFEECVRDVLLGIEYMKQRAIKRVLLVGHSFGGAVAIQAGVMSKEVEAVAGLASQTYGAQNVARLAPRSLLLIHGERDRNLPADCSRLIYRWAKEPKELHILKNNGHFLREAHKELEEQLMDWIKARFS